MVSVLPPVKFGVEVRGSSYLTFVALLLRMDAQDSIRGMISDSLDAVAESPHPKKIPQNHVRVAISLFIFIKSCR